jgi:hypothetical protein
MELVERTIVHIGKPIDSTMRDIFLEWSDMRKRQWVKGLNVIPVV